VLQCAAVCCSVLQCMDQRLAVYRSVLQCLEHCSAHRQQLELRARKTAVCRSVLQCVAVCCSMSQCVAVVAVH